MSGRDLVWGGLPYPYNLDIHSGQYDGDMRAGKGFLQPDISRKLRRRTRGPFIR
jgi:hypothetical protein